MTTRQDDQDEFGEWLASIAPKLLPANIESAAERYAAGVFTAMAQALQEGNVHEDLEAQVELLQLEFMSRAEALGIDEPAALTYTAEVASLAEGGVGTSQGPEYYRQEIAAALERLLGAIAKSVPTPGEAHVPGPLGGVVKRPRRRRNFLRIVKDSPELRATVTITKTDPDKRLVSGWVSIIEDDQGNPITDAQGDVIDEDELVATAHNFMKESREAGDSHKRIKGIGTVVDSMVFTRELKEKLGFPNLPTGWLITVLVDDESTWQRVKSGELAAFSIGGTAIREQI